MNKITIHRDKESYYGADGRYEYIVTRFSGAAADLWTLNVFEHPTPERRYQELILSKEAYSLESLSEIAVDKLGIELEIEHDPDEKKIIEEAWRIHNEYSNKKIDKQIYRFMEYLLREMLGMSEFQKQWEERYGDMGELVDFDEELEGPESIYDILLDNDEFIEHVDQLLENLPDGDSTIIEMSLERHIARIIREFDTIEPFLVALCEGYFGLYYEDIDITAYEKDDYTQYEGRARVIIGMLSRMITSCAHQQFRREE